MREASATGQASKQRASESLSAENRAQGQMAIQGGQAIGQAVGSYEDRQLRKDIATGQEIQAEKARQGNLAIQGLEESPGGAETPLMAEHRQGLEGDVQRGEDAQKQLDGPQQQGGEEPQQQGAGQAPPPAASRLENPQQAMQQAQTPLETIRPGQIRPTQQAMQQQRAGAQQQARENQLAQGELAIKDRDSKARFDQGKAAMLTAQSKAGEAGDKARAAAMKQMETGMENTRANLSKMLDPDTDYDAVLALFPNNENAQAAIGTDQAAPVAARLLSNQLATQNIQWMGATGLAGPDYDGTNEIWQEYGLRMSEMNAAFRGNNVLSAATGTDESLAQPFQAAVRGAGGGVGGPMRQAWSGFSTYEEKQSFLRKATARAMTESMELRRQAGNQMKVSGMAQQLSQSKMEGAEKDAIIADLRAQLGYGPEGELQAGANVTELEGGQRVPTDVAGETEERIEGQRAGKPKSGTIDRPEPFNARGRSRHGGAL